MLNYQRVTTVTYFGPFGTESDRKRFQRCQMVPVVRVAVICQYSTETISTSSNAMDLIIPIYHNLSISIHTPVNSCMYN